MFRSRLIHTFEVVRIAKEISVLMLKACASRIIPEKCGKNGKKLAYCIWTDTDIYSLRIFANWVSAKIKFCAAGYGQFIRNLTSLEIQEQVHGILDMTRGAVLKISQMCEVNNSKLLPSRKFVEFVTNAEHVIGKVEVFLSDGTDVNAGCGQFYNKSVI